MLCDICSDLVQTKEMLKTQMASVHSSASSALTMSGMQVNTLEVEIATLAEENRALKERLARQVRKLGMHHQAQYLDS